MNKIILKFTLLLLCKTFLSQDNSKCSVFKDLVPPNLIGLDNQNVWKLNPGDTVYFNEDWLKKIKIGGEKYILTNHYAQTELKGKNYRIVYREEIFNGKVQDLVVDTVYYDTWFKITNPSLTLNEIQQYAWVNMPNKSDFEIKLIPNYHNGKKLKEIEGCIIRNNYTSFNPEKRLNQKLVVSWINHRNNQVEIILRTFDKSEYFAHSFDRSIFYQEYPLLITEAAKRLSGEREKFKATLSSSIKDVKFTYPDRDFNNFKIAEIYFDKSSRKIYLIAEKFNIESKKMGIDTILFSNRVESIKYMNNPYSETSTFTDENNSFFDYDCYIKTANDFYTANKIKYEKYLKANFTEKEIKAIQNKSIFIGMSEKGLIECLGYPFDGINQIVMDGLNFKQYVYGLGQYVYISNGRISSFENLNAR